MKQLKSTALICLAALVLFGCTDKQETSAQLRPQSITSHDRCHLCGMVIAHYEGPKAQIFIKGAEDSALKFCSGRDAFTFALQPENARRLRGFFIQSIKPQDWSNPPNTDFIDATSAFYVYNAGIDGVMGEEMIAFPTREAADAFAAKSSGKVYPYSQLTLEVLSR